MADLSHIDYWIFDLDNTLYPRGSPIMQQIERRMTEFVAAYLELSHDAAFHLQKQYLRDYGTTLAGLIDRHNMPPHDYLDYVHDIDADALHALAPNPALAGALEKLPGKKFIFTNSTHTHSTRVLARLGVEALFDDIFDIFHADFIPKPTPHIYPAMLAHFGARPEKAAFFEDSARNLEPASALGMTTIYIRDKKATMVNNQHIDYSTQDLTTFLINL